MALFFSMEEERDRSVKGRLVSMFLKAIVSPGSVFSEKLWHKSVNISFAISMLALNDDVFRHTAHTSSKKEVERLCKDLVSRAG